jgi:hypothetical protein
MKRKGLTALLVAAVLCAFANVYADTESPVTVWDTVRIGGGPLVLGQSRPLSLTIVNDEALAIYQMGLISRTVNGGFAVWDSVVYIGRMADPSVFVYRLARQGMADPAIGTSPDTLVLAGLRLFTENFLPAGNDAIMQLYFTGVATGAMKIDTGFFLPNGPFAVYNQAGQKIVPKYVCPPIQIVDAPTPPSLTVPGAPILTVANAAVEFDIVATSAGGTPATVLETMHRADNDQTLPVSQPTLIAGSPLKVQWTPTVSDVGIWTLGIRTCDGPDNCVERSVEIQVVAGSQYLVKFNSSSISNVCDVSGLIHGDFDGDGKDEVFVTGRGGFGGSTAELYEYGAAEGLRLAFQLPISGNAKVGPQRAYINGDPDLDVVLEGFDRSAWHTLVALGASNGSFNFTGTGDDGHVCRATTLGEFTGDGYLDLATVSWDGVTIFAGNSLGGFEYKSSLAVPDSALALNSADFNGDGRDDLAVGTKNGVRIYLRSGPGTFISLASYNQVYGSLDIEVTNQGSDFNGDGYFDLCVSTPSVGGAFSDLVVYLGQANGAFTQHTIRTVAGQIFGNCVGDFNGDGKLDIAFVNGARRYVSILFGDGDGTFANELRYPIPHAYPRHIDGFDIDLDGDLDMVIAAPDLATGSVLFALINQSNPPGFSHHSLSISAADNAQLDVTSPSGRVLNRNCSTMPSAAFFKRTGGQNTSLDDFASVNLVETGEYSINVRPRPEAAEGAPFGLNFLLDGEQYRLARNAPLTAACRFGIYPADQSYVLPRPGKIINDDTPTLSWPGSGPFELQVATDIGFTNLLVNTTVAANSFAATLLPASPDTVTYYWRYRPEGGSEFRGIYVFNISTAATAVDDNAEAALPGGYALHQNVPNPFNPATAINYVLPKSTRVTIRIYNALGQEVKTLIDEVQSGGDHCAIWNGVDRFGNSAPSGVYFYRLQADQYTQSRKMLLLK